MGASHRRPPDPELARGDWRPSSCQRDRGRDPIAGEEGRSKIAGLVVKDVASNQVRRPGRSGLYRAARRPQP